MKYQRVLTEIYHKPWAILPEKFATISEIVQLRASGEKLTQEEIRARLGPHLSAAAQRDGAQSYGVVAVIPIYGVISHRMNLMSQISGGTSAEKLTAQFRQALADPSVKAIVFDVDSPGGSVEGVPELADEIMKSRSKKKTVAVANSMAASAAYWLASAADELVVIPSGQVGSVGVFCEHQDFSKALESEGVKVNLISAGKFKVEGNPYEPLSDEARAALQGKVEAFYEMFVKSVAKGRGVAQTAVREGFGQGRMVLAADAVKGRMADRVATMDETLSRLGASGAPKKMAAAAGLPAISAGALDGCECECAECMDDNCFGCTNAECADLECAVEGCPNQARASAAAPKRPPRALLERELDLH